MKQSIGLKRVVVTGLGMVTSLGLDVTNTWDTMLAGQSGVDYITQWGELAEVKEKFNLSEDFPLIAGEVKEFNIKKIIKERKEDVTKEDLKQVKYMDAAGALTPPIGLQDLPAHDDFLVVLVIEVPVVFDERHPLIVYIRFFNTPYKNFSRRV